jgi:hypothetical protein
MLRSKCNSISSKLTTTTYCRRVYRKAPRIREVSSITMINTYRLPLRVSRCLLMPWRELMQLLQTTVRVRMTMRAKLVTRSREIMMALEWK